MTKVAAITGRRGLQLVAFVVLASAVVAVVVLTRSSSTSGGPATTEVGGAPTVAVTRGDITAVISLDGALVPSPRFVVVAPRSGTVARAGLGPGRAVAAGGVVGRTSFGPVRAPVAGTFVRWRAAAHASIAAGIPIAELQYGGFGVRASLPPEAAYRIFSGRLEARAEILNGPGPFSCQVLTPADAPVLPDPHGVSAGDDGPGTALLCAVPPSVRAVQGLRALVAVRSAERRGVLTLPTSAVAGSAQRGDVSEVDANGHVRLQTVNLGITDGAQIQITSGLEAGDRVLARAPHLGLAP